MLYQWNDYRLDTDARVLTRNGRIVVASRKVLDCICHLVEHRDRIVGHDELIDALWGVVDVTNHQLVQVVVAARRTLGDDGKSQRMIRTVSGHGYRWMMPLREVRTAEEGEPMAAPREAPDEAPDEAPHAAPSPSVAAMPPDALELPDAADDGGPSSAGAERASRPARARLRRLAWMMGLLSLLAVLASVYRGGGIVGQRPDEVPLSDRLAASADPIHAMHKAMRMGLHEDVHEALAKLPLDLADTPEARMLEIELDIERGRFESADRKLAAELQRARSGADRVWQARVFVLRGERHNKAGDPAPLCLVPAQTALVLLASAGRDAPPDLIGRALALRGAGFLIANELPPAMQDLVRARGILDKAGDEWNAALTRRYLAHVWLRMGRMTDAREQMVNIADTFRRLGDPVNEIGTRNLATRIQAEQLRWDEALAGSKRNLEASRAVPVSRRRIGALVLRGLVLTKVGRLREAQSLFEEAEAFDSRFLPVYLARHALVVDRADLALARAAEAFDVYGPEDLLNLNLESQEGALLLWMTAAQRLRAQGEPMPEPSPAQRALLSQPQSNIGRIAQARWMWSQGRQREAEALLRELRERPRAPGWLSETLLAHQALIDLLLERGDAEAARRALTELLGHDPERFSADYEANLLGLRVALAEGDDRAVEAAYREVQALAGERVLPGEVQEAYRSWRRRGPGG